MDNIIITARYDGDKFDDMLGPSIKNIQTKCVNVSDKPDSVESDKTISTKYNVGILTAIKNNLVSDDTIVILCKSNVSISDPIAIPKLEYVFSTKPEIGIIGVKGITKINEYVELYNIENNPLNGIVYNNIDPKKGEYVGTNTKGFFTDIIAMDDSFIAIRGKVLHNIDKLFSISTNYGFGIEAVIKVLNTGYGSGIIDLFVISSEHTNINIESISDICDKLNLTLPLSIEDLNISKNFIVDVEL